MKQVKFNDGWKFWLDKNAFALVWNIPEHAQEVTLPHDAMLESRPYAESLNGGNTGYRDGEVYNYVKILHPEAEDAGKTLMLKFETQRSTVGLCQRPAGREMPLWLHRFLCAFK